MMRALAIAACLLGAACDQGRKPTAERVTTPEDCNRLLAHLIDLEFAAASGAATTDVMRDELAKQKAAVIAAKHDEFARGCLTMPRQRVMCVLAATDHAAVDKCDDEPAQRR